jgi:hypothetical protein
MKRIIVCIFFAVMATVVFAQEKGKVRLGFDAGNHLGTNFLYNIQDNINVGIKWGIALTTRESQYQKIRFRAGISNLSAISNYYFSIAEHSTAFIGGGLGRYRTGFGGLGCTCAIEQKVQKYHNNKFGGFLTTGIEGRKCRLALEYNFVPSSSVLISNHYYNDNDIYYTQVDDKIKNSYFAITIGVFMGGGKWGK